MNQMKWMIPVLVLVLVSARAQAQFPGAPDPRIPQFQPGIRLPESQPDIRMPQFQFRPDLQLPQFRPTPPLSVNEIMGSPKAREFKSPAWACWQSALGLVALSFVIGFLYGRFGSSD